MFPSGRSPHGVGDHVGGRGALTLVGVLVSNSRSQAVTEVKLDNLASKMAKHNSMVERTYALERRMAVLESEIESLAMRKDS